ncbi:uncharacterized protein LOC113463787 isoform X2 [Ceratina calcarata]|nr:uncharacterized protein LOC113463787 isoform X2 [Ceratina calcarata]
MNRTFNAFQMAQKPEITSYRKHIRLKKSMTLPDDTLEYWGFYLMGGASVALSVCSRFEGASILVVKGERNLRTCGIIEHHNTELNKANFMPGAKRQVKITFESNAKEIRSNEAPNETGDKLSNNTDQEFHSRGNLKYNKENLMGDSKKLIWDEDQAELVRNTRKLRHARKKEMKEKEQSNIGLRRILSFEEGIERIKRNNEVVNPTLLLDQGVKHGGNAGNLTKIDEDSSVSSFENELFNCYGGSILIAQEFAPSKQCTDVTYLLNGKHMQAVHNVEENGYYYYIFYSDNDIVSNDIHALFDIYKPVFHYEDVTSSCINQTKCSFPISLLSSDRVIVEIPNKDDIDNEIEDINLLLSICHPRMEVYIIFPVAVLFFILACAFM